MLFKDTFSWKCEGEEWNRDSYVIEDFPEFHGSMLRHLLMRKLVIYCFANSLGDNQEELSKLGEEIQVLLSKIDQLQETYKQGLILSDPSSLKEALEEAYEESLYDYHDSLLFFVQ